MTYLVEWSMVKHLKYSWFQLHLQPRKQKKYTMIFKMLPIYIVLSFLLFFSYIGEAKENENRAGKICEYMYT